MPKFRATFTKYIEEVAVFAIEADSNEAAAQIANKMVNDYNTAQENKDLDLLEFELQDANIELYDVEDWDED